jgi:uncharacterized membrane protein YebE (DUF533 family)
MSKKKLAATVLFFGLVVGGGVWGVNAYSNSGWEGRKAEFTQALSARFEQTGAPTKDIADRAAACIADAVIPAVAAIDCSTENKDVLLAMNECAMANSEIGMLLGMSIQDCIAKTK